MNKTAELISTLEALFNSQVKMAEAHGLDTLPHISTSRGREILLMLRAAKHEAKQKKKPNQSFFDHLDKIHAWHYNRSD